MKESDITKVSVTHCFACSSWYRELVYRTLHNHKATCPGELLKGCHNAPVFPSPSLKMGLRKVIDDKKAINHKDRAGIMSFGEKAPKSASFATKDGPPKLELVMGRNDIEVFSMSIKEWKYADILSTMSSADIDAAVNMIVTIRKKFQSTSYDGATSASAKEQPKVKSNFHTLVADPIFDGVNVSIPRKVVKKEQLGETWAEKDYDEFQRLLFFKFNSWASLEAVLEGSPWLIQKSPIILKKWSMDTRLLKEELTRFLIWVKLHNVPIQVFEEDGISLIATFIGKLLCLIHTQAPCVMNRDVTTLPTVTTFNVITPTIEKTNDGFQTVGKKKKREGKSKSTNAGQFTSPSVKQNDRYEPKGTTTAPKKGATYVEDNEEDVEIVHDESANLNTKSVGSLSFMAAAG
nr:hypothetical protein [Tanacetum cinerariifolium]